MICEYLKNRVLVQKLIAKNRVLVQYSTNKNLVLVQKWVKYLVKSI